MDWLALPFSPSGRIASKPFAIAAMVVYAAIALSQLLLSAPLTARSGLALFAIAQAMLTWVWYALHAKRLRDAGRPTGTALGIGILYGMSVVLLLLLTQVLLGLGVSAGSNDPDGGLAPFIVIAFLLALFSGEPGIGPFLYVAIVVLAVVFAPLLIALGYSVWAGTRPSVAAAS